MIRSRGAMARTEAHWKVIAHPREVGGAVHRQVETAMAELAEAALQVLLVEYVESLRSAMKVRRC